MAQHQDWRGCDWLNPAARVRDDRQDKGTGKRGMDLVTSGHGAHEGSEVTDLGVM